MNHSSEIICIACPKGCRTEVVEKAGEVIIVEKICKQGKAYVKQEFKAPRRMLTTTVIVENSPAKRLAVRTAAAIPKNDIRACMKVLCAAKVSPPVKMGEIIVENISDGIDVIASEDLR
jgi:CxxC motif-containing protein